MAFQTPISIAQAIKNIDSAQYLLPAIQREFVWSHEKIEWLFDSIMQGYPISSFLFWHVEKETAEKQKFYRFLSEYRERFNTHNTEFNTNGCHSFTAILDGQQRLTSLYLGLKGSYAYKEYRKTWIDNDINIPKRELYLNLTNEISENENGQKYQFKFLKVNDTSSAEIYQNKNNIIWFKVGSILNYENADQLDDLIDNHLSGMSFAKKTVRTLRRTIFDEKLINFFLEPKQDIDKALNIFIRINSGGEPLSFSDLIMSIAVSNWKTLNARDEIHYLVDTVRGIGFNISKDLVLKSFLYLYSNNIKFMVKNFSIDNAQQFEDQWVNIKECLIETFNLIKALGFNDITLTSKNSILPIFYWLYHLKIYKDFSTKIKYKDQRNQIKEWLHIALIKQVFSGTSDNVLTQIREALTSGYTLTESEFPKSIIFNKIKKNLSVGEDFISDLLNTQYEDKRAFSILALLYPYLDYKNNNFHKDHLHPKTSFSELKNSSYAWKEYNSIVNLQMLDSNENMSKNDISLEKWCNNHHDIPTFKKQFLIPENESLELSNFDQFYIARKNILFNKLLAILEVPQVLNQIEVPQTCNQSFIPEYHSFTVYNESEQENILLEIDFQNHINSVPSKYISHDNLLKLKMLHENQQLQYLSFDEHPKKIQKIIPVTQKIWKLQVVDLTSIDNIDNNWETCDLNNL